MNEIKQANFRISQDDADAFRQYCESNGYNQAQGFEHLIQVMELNNAKIATPGRAVEIEDFERNIKAVMSAYLNSIEINNNSEARIREEFSNSLTSKDKTISDLQDKVTILTEDKESAEETSAKAAQAAAQAMKEADIAKEQAEIASKLAEERNRTITTLADKLALAEEEANGYDSIVAEKNNALSEIEKLKDNVEKLKSENKTALDAAKAEYDRKINELNNTHTNAIKELTASKDKEIDTLNNTIDTLKKDHATEIKELNAEMERKVSDANKDSALALEKAVAEKERELNAKNIELEKANAKLETQIEMLKERIAELTATPNSK